MGVDLTLMPAFAEGSNFSHTLLPIGQDFDLNKTIEVLQAEKGSIAPKPVTCYVAHNTQGDAHYGEITEDCYGKPIGYIFAKDLKKIKLGKEYSPRQKAAFEYIKCLSDSLEIYLYWH